MIKQLKSVHFYFDAVLFIGLCFALSVNGININENPIGWCSIAIITVLIGINGYVSGIKSGIDILKSL